MYHRERRKLKQVFFIVLLSLSTLTNAIEVTEDAATSAPQDEIENIIDFDEDYSLKYDKKYGSVAWSDGEKYNKESNRYTVVKDAKKEEIKIDIDKSAKKIVEEATPAADMSVLPLELLSTTENPLFSIIESTTDADLTVIPLSTTKKTPFIEIKQTVTLPTSTQGTDTTETYTTTENDEQSTTVGENSETTTAKREITTRNSAVTSEYVENIKIALEPETRTTEDTIETTYETTTALVDTTTEFLNRNIKDVAEKKGNDKKDVEQNKNQTEFKVAAKTTKATKFEALKATNGTKQKESPKKTESDDKSKEVDSFSELDHEDVDVPEDYYDSKDVVPTTTPKKDPLSVIFGFAGSVVESVVESVAEKVVPKGIFDLFKRMQKQSEALEAERLRSREENGGLGQFGRGILKSISTGISRPLSQLMAGVKDIGSLDTDRGFVSELASGVTSVATSLGDVFKDRVQAIYPGTVWCGDGHSAQARSSDLGLFFFTDTCCRQHDACKLYIRAGDTRHGLTNTGLFTRSHCSCDARFRECLKKTNSLVSAQIGLTYFNVLGPQCFRKAHPIVRCARRTRLTGQKCEEYELDYTKPKMWQWFDNETF